VHVANDHFKLLYFQRRALEDSSQAQFNAATVCTFIREYISRFDDELAQLEAHRKKYSRPPTARELMLKTVVHDEVAAFTRHGGFEAPDMTNAATCKVLREWNGAVQFADKIQLRSFKDVSSAPITPVAGGYREAADDNDGDDDDHDDTDDDDADDDSADDDD